MTQASRPLQGLHLLVVEDDQDIRKLISIILRAKGAEVTTVSHVSQALEVLEQFRPDVVLSDVYLPDGDAYALLKLWRKKEVELWVELVPAIMVTESDRETDGQRIYQEGFQAYISRPFDLARIAEIVSSVV